MAGNFWKSSHYSQWLLDRQDLMRERAEDLKVLTEENYQKIMIFFANFIQVIGESQSQKIPQQVIATATVYFKRFYARNSLKSIDPFLMSPTCIFLACKVEEFGLISNPKLMQSCATIVKTRYQFAFPGGEYPYRHSHVNECEFYLLEMMDCCLVVYHPYRPLAHYIKDMQESGNELLGCAWRVVNDTLRTDIPLKYPPHLVALASINIACVMKQKDSRIWFADLNVDLEKIQEIIRQTLSLYDLWKKYDEKKEIPGILEKMPRPNISK